MIGTSLDFYFPYIVFAYGVIFTALTNLPVLEKIAQENFGSFVHQRWQAAHRLSMICLVVGAIWILQRLWI